jgi:TetR/AcrR family transcriptional repressor of nem operon
MRVTREEAQKSRERIVEAAARRFRERGFEGIGVADLMKEAGLTHGGFYGHFDSKEQLMAEAVARAMERSKDLWSRRAAAAPGDPLAALARVYLTPRHRDDPGSGCVVAALAVDAARQGPAVRGVLVEGLQRSFALLGSLFKGLTPAARRRKAIATYASWVGALVLARAAADDAALSGEILDAVAKESTER